MIRIVLCHVGHPWHTNHHSPYEKHLAYKHEGTDKHADDEPTLDSRRIGLEEAHIDKQKEVQYRQKKKDMH